MLTVKHIAELNYAIVIILTQVLKISIVVLF